MADERAGTEERRTALVAQVAEAVAAGLAGGPTRGAVLTGAPGIGKSTVLHAVADRLAAAGVTVLRAGADELSPREPFGLVQRLVGLPAGGPPAVDAAAQVLAAVDARCAAGPVVCCVDDAHHGDAESLAVLRRLATAAQDLRLGLLVARRPLPVREPLALLAARGDVLDVPLDGLGAPEVAELVVARLAAPPGPRLAEWLSSTGGNPFHVGEVLDELARRGQLRVVDGVVEVEEGELVAPPTLRASVAAHLGLLTGTSRDLVQVLAVWGGPASVGRLAAAMGVTPPTLLGPVQLAVTAGVVRWGEDGTLELTHDLLRDVAYAELAPPLRAVLHRSCAAVLAAEGAAAVTLTHHVERDGGDGGPGPDGAGALRRAAAEIATAPAVAAELLGVAVTLAADDPAARDAITVERAGALAKSGQWTEAARVVREAMARTADVHAHAGLRAVLAQCLISAGATEEVLALLAETRGLVADPEARRGIDDVQRWVVLLGRREPLAGPTPDLAAAVADTGGRQGARLSTAAVTAMVRGRFPAAVGLARAAAAVTPPVQTSFWAGLTTASLLPATATLHAEGPGPAAEVLAVATASAQHEGRLWLEPYRLVTAAEITAYEGRYDDAVAEFAAALEAGLAGGVAWLALAAGHCAALEVALGRLEHARERIAAWRADGRWEQFGMPRVGHAAALLAEAEGDAVGAAELAAAHWDAVVPTGRLMWLHVCGVETARLALGAGDRELLARVAEEATRLLDVPAGMHTPTPALLVAVAAGDGAACAAAAAACARWGNAPGEALAWEEAACAAAAAGDERAREWALRALALARRTGAVTDERRTTTRLRLLGVRLGAAGPRRRASTGWESLTRTERRVAELVGAGHSGPEIAAQLVVSPRTVQTHASRVLGKLGLRSRVELAAWLGRHGPPAP